MLNLLDAERQYQLARLGYVAPRRGAFRTPFGR
jgi:hypothetical protein